MSKREKIIVGLMCITIVMYGFYLLNQSGETPPTEPEKEVSTADLQKFIADVAQKLKQGEPSPADHHLISAAGSPWTKDPFLMSTQALTAEPDRSPPEPERVVTEVDQRHVYSGYLELADKRLAIIDGLEYEEGETLGLAGDYIIKIYPNRVILGKLDQGATQVLPLDENVTDEQ